MSQDKKLQDLLAIVLNGQDLTVEQMKQAVQIIMSGEANEIIMAAFLIALRMKKEAESEIQGAVEVMRNLVIPIDLGDLHDKAIDIVGTGGDGAQLFNVSTASAMVVAAAGGYVAKHGSRALSSKSGSADLLEQSGAVLDISPQQSIEVLRRSHFCFMFAPQYHKAMKHVANVRTTMAQRTVFNLLGPMTNPAKVSRQLMGCYDPSWLEPLAHVFASLGSKKVFIVHSNDGLDEVSLAAPTQVVALDSGEIIRFTIAPEEAGITQRSWQDCCVESSQESYAMICAAFTGAHQDAADMIALNSGLALVVADLAESFAQGVDIARNVIAEGAAMETFHRYVAVTKELASSGQ